MPIRVFSKRATAPAPSGAASVSIELPVPPAGYPQKPEGLSLCMIVKNEERFLERCLASAAAVVDEICIVDTGSTDRTMEIARKYGATIVEREWKNDFGWARNEALKLATKRWILVLDADEELRADSIELLHALKKASAYTSGVWVRCYNESDDYRGTGAMSHSLVRVFPNSERIRFRGRIHEFVTLDDSPDGLKAATSPLAVTHHGYLKEVVESRDKARRNYEIILAAAEADPSDPFVWFNVGSTAFLMGNYETARDGFEKMREINGKTPRGFITNGYAVLSEIYCDKLGDPAKGEQIAREALEFSPHYANAHFQLGKTLIAQRRFDDARDAFLTAIDDEKYAAAQFIVDDQVYIWKAHSEIGSTYVMQGNDASAIEWFRKGLKNAPNVQPIRLNLARALERTGVVEEAEQIYREVFEDARDDATTVEWVNYLLRRSRGPQALRIIDEMHPSLTNRTAVALLHAAAQIIAPMSPGEEVHYLELAADRDPGNSEVLNWLERVYRERGDASAIARLLEREATVEPVNAADFLRRSYHANVAHEFARALELCTRGLQLDPLNEHLHYNAATAAGALGQLDFGLAHLEHVKTQASPVHLPALMLRANIEAARSNNDAAIAAIESVLALDPAHVEALTKRAELYEARGDIAAAEQSLRRIIDVDRDRGLVGVATFLLRHGRFEEAAAFSQAALQH